jgi:hypothetical protein
MDVNIAKVLYMNRFAKVGQLVEFGFCFAPVECLFPVVRQTFDVG